MVVFLQIATIMHLVDSVLLVTEAMAQMEQTTSTAYSNSLAVLVERQLLSGVHTLPATGVTAVMVVVVVVVVAVSLVALGRLVVAAAMVL